MRPELVPVRGPASLVLSLLALLTGAAGAHAATFGSALLADPTLPAAPCPDAAERCTLILDRIDGDVRLGDGVITAWAVRAAAGTDADARLTVVRPDATGAPRPTAATSPIVRIGGGVQRFPARLTVAAGDRLGLTATSVLPVRASRAPARAQVSADPATPPVGRAGEEVLLQAEVEPDADRDGFGDATQDGCPRDSARSVAPCVADLVVAASGDAAAAAGRTATAVVEVASDGPERVARPQLTLAAADGGRIVALRPARGTCSPAAVCTLGPLARGERVAVEVQLTADAPAEAALVASVVSEAADPSPASTRLPVRFTEPSIEPARTPLTGPPCAAVTVFTRDDDVSDGTIFGDRLRGMEGRDLLRGGAGDDCLEGGSGNDVLSGGPGNDRLVGGLGRDRLYGDEGDDQLRGGLRNDALFGGPGDDRISPQGGADRVFAGSGDDQVLARDGVRERIDCGPGQDRVRADRRDRVRGCERVSRR